MLILLIICVLELSSPTGHILYLASTSISRLGHFALNAASTLCSCSKTVNEVSMAMPICLLSVSISGGQRERDTNEGGVEGKGNGERERESPERTQLGHDNGNAIVSRIWDVCIEIIG